MPDGRPWSVTKDSRGKLSAALGTDGFINRMWGEICSQEAVGKGVDGEENEMGAAGTGWQDESPYKEELELLRVSSDMRLDGTLIRQASNVGTRRRG